MNAYYHDMFIRGKPSLCARMRRPNKTEASAMGESAVPDFYTMDGFLPICETFPPTPSVVSVSTESERAFSPPPSTPTRRRQKPKVSTPSAVRSLESPASLLSSLSGSPAASVDTPSSEESKLPRTQSFDSLVGPWEDTIDDDCMRLSSGMLTPVGNFSAMDLPALDDKILSLRASPTEGTLSETDPDYLEEQSRILMADFT